MNNVLAITLGLALASVILIVNLYVKRHPLTPEELEEVEQHRSDYQPT